MICIVQRIKAGHALDRAGQWAKTERRGAVGKVDAVQQREHGQQRQGERAQFRQRRLQPPNRGRERTKDKSPLSRSCRTSSSASTSIEASRIRSVKGIRNCGCTAPFAGNNQWPFPPNRRTLPP